MVEVGVYEAEPIEESGGGVGRKTRGGTQLMK